jgi:hypothetical protein
VLDEVLPGIVEPVRIIDDHHVWYAAPHVFIRIGDCQPEVVGDVTLLGNSNHPAGRAKVVRLGHEPLDHRGFPDAWWTVDHDDNRLTGDRGDQPSRQLGALRDSPDDVDCHLDLPA